VKRERMEADFWLLKRPQHCLEEIDGCNYFFNNGLLAPKNGESHIISQCGVAKPDPEPVERQHFAGARAEVFWPGSGSEYRYRYVNSCKMLKKT
jgi:hypothetical protein